MMKSGNNIFSSCVLLLIISLPIFVAAISCPYGRINDIAAGNNGTKKCPNSYPSSCAAYICNGTVSKESLYVHDIGCIDDFLRDCHIFETEVNAINSSATINEMEYYSDRVIYVSGCGKAAAENITECILAKFNDFQSKIPKKNSSKGQDSNILKKVGCFIIGLTLAAWIY